MEGIWQLLPLVEFFHLLKSTIYPDVTVYVTDKIYNSRNKNLHYNKHPKSQNRYVILSWTELFWVSKSG